MKIKFLGSAAAECVPAIWCECENCRKARKIGGKDIRRRSSYLLDEDTLIDMGPDFFGQLIDFQIDERKIKRIIFTHRHEDHLAPQELIWRLCGYSKVSRSLRIFGGHHVFTRIAAVHAAGDAGFDFAKDLQLEPILLHHGEIVADGDLSILPVNAEHDPYHSAFLYLLSRGGKKLFIGNDSGALSEESMQLCAGANVDLMILDCTMGFTHADADKRHLGVNAVLRQVERFRRNGAIGPHTKLVVNHFSHNGNPIHADLEAFFNPRGIEVGYDGKEILL